MARKPKTEGARPAISRSKLLSLMASARAAKKDIAGISGSLGSEIKQAVENNHLNKKVFRDLCKLDRMEPEELKLYLEDFEHGLDISGLQARADSVQTMDLGDGDGDGEDEGDEGGKKRGKVTPFPAPASVAAE